MRRWTGRRGLPRRRDRRRRGVGDPPVTAEPSTAPRPGRASAGAYPALARCACSPPSPCGRGSSGQGARGRAPPRHSARALPGTADGAAGGVDALAPPVRRQAASSLRTARWRVRAASPSLLVDDPSGLRLLPTSRWTQGAEALALAMTERPADVIDTDPRRFAAELLPDSRDDWVLAQHAHLRELCLRAVEAQARHYLARSDYGSAIKPSTWRSPWSRTRERYPDADGDPSRGGEPDGALRAYLRLDATGEGRHRAVQRAPRARRAAARPLAPGAAERLLRWS